MNGLPRVESAAPNHLSKRLLGMSDSDLRSIYLESGRNDPLNTRVGYCQSAPGCISHKAG
jgi:hypothetical protein